jgi:tetratricopeptide (TPR) repeat protein
MQGIQTGALASGARWGVLALAALLACFGEGAQAQSAVDAQFRQGVYQRETGQPYAAIETLETLLSANPTLNRARLELAVAYYRTLNYTRAKAEAKRVLDDPKTPDAVRLSVMSFLKQLELDEAQATGKPNKFEPNVSLGLLYDSNVNAGPDNAIIGSSATGLLTVNDASLAKSDWGYHLQAGVNHTWQRPEPMKLGQTTARFGWASQASLYYKGYNRYNEYDLGVLTLATGPTLVVGSNWRGNLNLELDKITLGGDDLGLYTSLSPSIAWRLGTTGELSLDAQLVKRDFERAGDQARDSYYRSLGLSYGHLFYQGKLAAQVGLRVFTESAKADYFSNEGQEAFIGGRLRLWEGGDVFARTSWRHTNYGGIEPIFLVGRREIEHRYELGASHRFQAGWFEKWNLSATLTHVDNNANIGLYGYNRDTVLFALARSF